MKTPLLIACTVFFQSVALPAFAAGPATRPTTAAVTQPTAPGLEVHEWAVFVVDASAGKINPDGVVRSTLPSFVNDHRYGASGYTAPATPAPQAFGRGRRFVVVNGMVVAQGATPAQPSAALPVADVSEPTPVNIIRLIGAADSKVDVTVNLTNGAFLGSWPKAEERTNQLLWRDISLDDKAAGKSQPAPADSWFSRLREAGSSVLSIDKHDPEKFLMYDVEIQSTSPINVKQAKDGSVELTNATPFPLHELTLYQSGENDSLRSVEIGEIAGSNKAATQTPAAKTKPIEPLRLGIQFVDIAIDPETAKHLGYTAGKGVIVRGVNDPGPATAALKPADIIVAVDGDDVTGVKDFSEHIDKCSPHSEVKFKVFRGGQTLDVSLTADTIADAAANKTGSASTRPVKNVYKLVTAATTRPSDLTGVWKSRMATAGVDPADAAVISRIIDRYAMNGRRLTAMFRMDDAAFDKLLPIEIVPQPAKTKRFALVIVRNADPSAPTEIDDLIGLLGDDDWNKRDAAYRALADMGPAATAKLTTAKDNKDLEIAWRAERLLAMSAKPK